MPQINAIGDSKHMIQTWPAIAHVLGCEPRTAQRWAKKDPTLGAIIKRLEGRVHVATADLSDWIRANASPVNGIN